jgi:hypothetical protein
MMETHKNSLELTKFHRVQKLIFRLAAGGSNWAPQGSEVGTSRTDPPLTKLSPHPHPDPLGQKQARGVQLSASDSPS